MQEIRRAAQVPAGIENSSGPYRVIASTPDPGRDGFSIPTDAWRLDAFNANPVLLWAHRRDDLDAVIGRASIRRTDTCLEADIEFASAENPFAAQVERMWQAGYLRAVSVGGAIEEATPEGDGLRVDAITLLDLSVCPVGVDPQALAVARAFQIPDETVGRMFTPSPERELTPRLSAAAERLRLIEAGRRRN